jgi:hypothetical protein
MFERILIPLDGTEIAEVAIPYVEGKKLLRQMPMHALTFSIHSSGV